LLLIDLAVWNNLTILLVVFVLSIELIIRISFALNLKIISWL